MQSTNLNVPNIYNLCLCFCVDTLTTLVFVRFSLRINATILLLAIFLSLRPPRDVCSFSETTYYFIEGWPAWKRLVIKQVSFSFL